MHHPFRILLDPQGGPEGGKPAAAPATDPSEGFRKLLEKHNNDGLRLAESLHGENYQLREKLRIAEGRALSDGAVVLREDEIKKWNAYKDLGEPSELRRALSERDQFKDEADGFRRADAYAEAASITNLNAKAFKRLAQQERLQLEIRNAKDPNASDGRLVATAFVKSKDSDGKDSETPLSEYVTKSWPEFLPALQEGQKVEPSRPVGMPARRDPNPAPPPAGDGITAYSQPAVGPSIPRM